MCLCGWMKPVPEDVIIRSVIQPVSGCEEETPYASGKYLEADGFGWMRGRESLSNLFVKRNNFVQTYPEIRSSARYASQLRNFGFWQTEL